VQPPLHAKEDWKVFRALSEILGDALPYDNLAQLRAKVAQQHPAYQNIGEVVNNPWQVFGAKGSVAAKGFTPVVAQFYMTHEIMRASHVMRECQDLADGRKQPVKKAG
jgi:NADH-quinone oxidoreductase subunit G